MLSSASSVPCAPCVLLMFVNLGHYNLFDKGVLHRNVSPGNVLRYSVPVQRPALNE
jgi:hypothetical protein